MLNDTANRKDLALALLATGRHTIRTICRELHIHHHTIRNWKNKDESFKRKWNELMGELGRWVE